MANRRMISKSISVSDNVSELSDFAALLFTWMIPHTDDYGIIEGTAGKIKALIVPRRKQTEKQVESAMKELQNHKLIWRYIYKNNEYLQFCKFDEHQEGLHKRTSPKNPIYSEVKDDSENFREIPGNSPLACARGTEPKGIEPKGREGKEKTEYGEFVHLTEKEYERLKDEFGEDGVKRLIEILDNYKGSKNKKYADDNRAIRSWVIDRYKEEQAKKKPAFTATNWKDTYKPRPDPDCPECHGTGEIPLVTTDFKTGEKMTINQVCKCVKRKEQ